MYRSLDIEKRQIRLLRIRKYNSARREIHGSLHICSLDDCCPYSAVSYEWDPSSFEQLAPLTLLTQSGHSLQLGSNLSAFLIEHTKQNTKPYKLLWIDAICINQRDRKERATQVAIMRQIYSQAICVLAWLGPHHSMSKTAMHFFLEMAAFEPLSLDRRRRFLSTKFLLEDQLQNFEISQMPTLSAITGFFARSYWKRTWMVQEVNVESDKVWAMCGDDGMRLVDLRNAMADFTMGVGEFDVVSDKFLLQRIYLD